MTGQRHCLLFCLLIACLAACGCRASPQRNPAEAAGQSSSGASTEPSAAAVSPAQIAAEQGADAAPPPESTGGFDGRRAYTHVARLVAIGPRSPGTEGIRKAREYIRSQLQTFGCKVETDNFHASTIIGSVAMENILVNITGESPNVILLTTHYDTKRMENFVGANDGGSSTGLMLELARLLCSRKNALTVWIAFFDGEEDRDPLFNRAGLHGSRHLVEELARTGELGRVRAAVVLDMIGDRDLDIRRDAGSASWLNELLWNTARRLGYGRHFLDETAAIEDDQVPLLQAGIAAALLIDYTYGPTAQGRGFWHTPQDTPDKLSPRSLQVVGDVLLGALPEIEAALRRR